MDKEVVTELIQNDFNSANLKVELNKILHDESKRSEMISNFAALKSKLGGRGASKKAAGLMIKYLD